MSRLSRCFSSSCVGLTTAPLGEGECAMGKQWDQGPHPKPKVLSYKPHRKHREEHAVKRPHHS